MGAHRQVPNATRNAQSEAARLAAKRKMYSVWFVAVIVPFAILFCLFPSSNPYEHRASQLPASTTGRLVSGDTSLKQQVIVEDSILNPLEQDEKRVATKADREPERKEKSRPGESFVDLKNRGRKNNGMETTKSKMQDSVAGDPKKNRSYDKNVSRKPSAKGFESLRVKESDELGFGFGVDKGADRIQKTRGSEKPKVFREDLLQSSDSSQWEIDPSRTARNHSPALGGSLKKRMPSKDSQQPLTNREEFILPEVVMDEKNRGSEEKPKLNSRTRASVECNISKGHWRPDSNAPRYANVSCPWIDEENEKCMNGTSIRDTKHYPHWRWKPTGCVLKRFTAKAFLKMMEHKAMAFVGDSLARAQARSLVCLLSRVESPKSLYISKENQSSSWHFPSSNFTLMAVWSPFLVQETEDWINGAPDGVRKVRLDVVEPKWARLMPKLDAVVLNTGSWFRLPVAYVVKNQLVGCSHCGAGTAAKELGLYSAYRAAIRSAIIGATTLPLFTGTTVVQETIAEEPGSCTMSSSQMSSLAERKRRQRTEKLSNKMNEIQRDEVDRALKRGLPNGSRLELSEITTLTFQHPAYNVSTDSVKTTTLSSTGNVDIYCTSAHSCLTGPSVTWNQLLLRILRRPDEFVTIR